jgi:predicted Zn-dependent protease
VAAALFDAGVRTLLTTEAQRRPDVAHRIATRRQSGLSPVLTLTDNPTIRDAYGAFRFDDAGTIAVATPLVDAGRIVGRVDRPRRAGHIGPREIASSHLVVTAGTTPVDNLLDKGMLLEGHTHTLVDPTSDRFVIQVARARELAGGKRTGKIFADVELAGELTNLFGSLGAVSKETRTIGFRDERDGLPRHRSIEVPYLRSAGLLRQRRRPS